MKDVLVYQPPGDPAQVALFIEGLEPKLREKLLRQIIPLPRMPPLSCGSPITSTLPLSGTAVSMKSGQKTVLLSASSSPSCCCTAFPSGNPETPCGLWNSPCEYWRSSGNTRNTR